MSLDAHSRRGTRIRPVGTSLAEASHLDPHALVIMDLAARAAGTRREERVLALRDEYAPALDAARRDVAAAIGGARRLGRPARPVHRPGAAAPLAEAALHAAPPVVALGTLGAGAGIAVAAALGAVLWIAAGLALARLERGILYSHGSPRVTRAGAKYIFGDLVDAHASELLEEAGAPAVDVAALRRRWAAGMAAVLAWRRAVALPDGGSEPRV